MKRLLFGAVCCLAAAGASADDFFSTEPAENLFTFGARIGVNTSNRTLGNDCYPDGYHNESWGTGFDLGFVANINFRNYFSIQPGIFFESRSGGYTVMGSAKDSGFSDDGSKMAQAGKRRSYNITIPVMAVVGFNVTDDVRWSVEAGPYVSFVLDSSLKNKAFIVDGQSETPLFMQDPASVDFGFKMGTGIEVLKHYYVGAHYMAGCIDAWKDRKIANVTKNFGGHTKAWVFTIGYNF